MLGINGHQKAQIAPIGGRIGFWGETDWEKEPENVTVPTAKAQPLGRLAFATSTLKETPGALGDLFKEIFSVNQAKEGDTKVILEAQRVKRYYEVEQGAQKNLAVDRQKNLMEEALRISGGTMSVAEVATAVFTSHSPTAEALSSIGISHVVQVWEKRQSQIEQTEKQKQSQELAQASKGTNLLGRLDAQEGQSMVANAIMSAG